ncbi:hypothetical protein A1O1_02393 [Capronia coronata CBS 617.96]|uniref:WW domain-containing protein n=1 Tax=Capronia coronata CBS 617.96 TaxID=1182541 RepID=W9YWF3_9EURO|nr:uncharacterized protein A1O1_02393 [Capronia coronata CBS 617.96]EXJ94000.1 hypothetical protein A1O1_02393 [Capronia coronata CBS 617.96]
MSAPAEPPPSYAAATGSSTTSAPPHASSHLEVPKAKNGIPALARRSMEDLQRPLPDGWVRSYDPKENHQFFVNTKEDPPKSYWEHPLDIPEVVQKLSTEERERLQEEEDRLRKHLPHSADHSEDEAHTSNPSLPPRPATGKAADKKSFGEKLKDKVTGTTHEERVRDRARREEEERRYYEAHLKLRQAMQKAQMTGQPQFFAKDKDGKDIYIEPPSGPGYGYGGYGARGYGVNPFAQGPYYANPNVRVIRPTYPYNRPYGQYGGGGVGLPIAGGLLGGMLLGGLLF